MRKTLTVIFALAAAGSLAACKPFWEKDPKPEAVATTPTEPTATASTVTADTPTTPEQTASTSTDKPVVPTGEKTDAPMVPAKK